MSNVENLDSSKDSKNTENKTKSASNKQEIKNENSILSQLSLPSFNPQQLQLLQNLYQQQFLLKNQSTKELNQLPVFQFPLPPFFPNAFRKFLKSLTDFNLY